MPIFFFLTKNKPVWKYETFPTVTVISYVYAIMLDHIMMNYTVWKHFMWQVCLSLQGFSSDQVNQYQFFNTQQNIINLNVLKNKKGWNVTSVQNYIAIDLQRNASICRYPLIFLRIQKAVCKSVLEKQVLWYTLCFLWIFPSSSIILSN